jgi:hypothetical protein
MEIILLMKKMANLLFSFRAEWKRVHYYWGHYWPVMLYATSQKVIGSSANEVTDFSFRLLNPSSRTIVLGFTQPLTEMSRRYFWG